MNKLARDVMTPDPACCTPETSLEDVAKMMVRNDCGEIPVVDGSESRQLIGVITDRDIVCRVLAHGKNPVNATVETCMTQPAVTVQADDDLNDVVATMEKHQIRRVPVVDEREICVGIITQADVAWSGGERDVATLVREVSREIGKESR